MFQDPLTRSYDAIIVGSGATGGWAAKRLSEAGLEVALLEAGRSVSTTEFTEHNPVFELRYSDISGAGEWRKTRPSKHSATPVPNITTIGLSMTSKTPTAHRPASRSVGSACAFSGEERCAGLGKAIA